MNKKQNAERRNPSITFYFFRHGETDWNREQRFQGHADIPLNALGIEQANALPALLAPLGLTHLISSDLKRARLTAEYVSQALGLPLAIDARLREANLGQAQGLTTEEIRARFGDALLSSWRGHRVEDQAHRYPDGESGTEVLTRVFAALASLHTLPDLSRVGICTHGGVIRRILQSIHPEPHLHHPIPNTVVYALTLDTDAPHGLRFESRLR